MTKTYGAGQAAVQALRGVDLDVRTGELMMLVGPSGCGKTTLISVIAGVLDRNEGACTVFGEDFARMSARARTRWRGENVGFVFQAFNLIPTITAAENVAVPLMILGEGHGAAIRRAREVLEMVGLGERWRALPSQLSGGQQQRVAGARSLAMQPALLLADEPTGNLDTKSAEDVFALLRQVNREHGTSVLFVTHNAALAARCDRTIEVVDGRVR